MCLLVWLSLDGSLDTHMWCMAHSAMEQRLSCLRALQPTLMQAIDNDIIKALYL